jgi:hypothetical protein
VSGSDLNGLLYQCLSKQDEEHLQQPFTISTNQMHLDLTERRISKFQRERHLYTTINLKKIKNVSFGNGKEFLNV